MRRQDGRDGRRSSWTALVLIAVETSKLSSRSLILGEEAAQTCANAW